MEYGKMQNEQENSVLKAYLCLGNRVSQIPYNEMNSLFMIIKKLSQLYINFIWTHGHRGPLQDDDRL